ncbi:MAG: lytic murein transglycosylase, partial [Shewanella sp.]
SQYLSYGVDGDDDGKVDIWQNHADIFATIANILKQQGWQQEATWGRQVQLPVDFDLSQAHAPQAFSYWQQQGVRRFDGTDLPNVDSIRANVIAPDGIKGRIYLVYDNYRAINAWFDNHYDSISVTYLSERIKFPQLK